MKVGYLKTRDAVLRSVRSFFHAQEFIEVETPVRIAAPAPELHIDAPPSGKAWLRASPELQMKCLLCEGVERIFQIGPCFRDLECGKQHNPEFTMLEWYRAHADYNDIRMDTTKLINQVVNSIFGCSSFPYQGMTIDVTPPWPVVSVQSAFVNGAGWDPVANWDSERFDHDMVKIVEPSLQRETPVILSDYPAAAASLARLSPTNHLVAERWELYIGGLELANAYSELCDSTEQLARFEVENKQRQAAGKPAYPIDTEFIHALETRGLPPSGGIALGVDRLVMLMCNTDQISAARIFCQQPGKLL